MWLYSLIYSYIVWFLLVFCEMYLLLGFYFVSVLCLSVLVLCTLRPPYCPLGRNWEGERECPETNRLTDNRLYSLLSKPAIRCLHRDGVDQVYSNQRFGSRMLVIMDSRFPFVVLDTDILSPGTNLLLFWGQPHWGQQHQRTLLWSWSASEAVIIALPWKRCVTNPVLTRVYSSVNYWLSYCNWARLQLCSIACLMNSLKTKYHCPSTKF